MVLKGTVNTEAFQNADVIHMHAHSQVTVVLGISVFERFDIDGEDAAETVVWTRSVFDEFSKMHPF